jgi:hypothetical protein
MLLPSSGALARVLSWTGIPAHCILRTISNLEVPKMTHAESWHARRLPRIGQTVRHAPDPRHEGVVTAILHSTVACITWANGWKSQLQVCELEVLR